MATKTQTARQVRAGLKKLDIVPAIMARIGQDLIVCEWDQIDALRAEAAVVDRVLGVINSMLREYETDGNTGSRNGNP